MLVKMNAWSAKQFIEGKAQILKHGRKQNVFPGRKQNKEFEYQ